MFRINPFRIDYSIKKFKKNMKMHDILKNYKVSEDFIKEFMGHIAAYSWGTVSGCQKLSESFIREFQDKLDWMWISIYQKLSESFIIEFKEKIRWSYISENQILSEEFLLKHRDSLNYYCLVKNKNINIQEEFKKIVDRIKNESFLNIGISNCEIIRKELEKLEKKNKERNKFTRFEIMEI